MSTHSTCKTCHEIKTIEEFRVLNGYRKHTCRRCLNLHRRSQYKRGQTSKTIKTQQLTRMYGITLEEYDELSAYEYHVCAICKLPCKTGKRLAVDHCHVTGRVRGLLCANCNNGLGRFNDDPNVLREAITYLEETK